MKRRLSLFALLLVLVMILTMVSSCGGTTEESVQGQTSDGEFSSDASTEESTQPTEDVLTIPEGFKWDKEDFVILTGGRTGSRFYGVYTEFGFNADELEANVINDAVNNRNLAIEDLIGVRVVEKMMINNDCSASGEMYSTVFTQINGGLADYDLVAPSLYQGAALAINDCLYNMLEIENNQLEKDWWDQFFIDEVAVNDRLYFVTGDIGFFSRASVTVIYFNKETARNLELGDVYALAREKKFTFDTMYSWMKLQEEDINADDVIDYKDKFGLGSQNDFVWALFYGAGQGIARKGEDDKPYLTINTETALTISESISKIFTDSSFVNANHYFNVSSSPTKLLTEAFAEGRSLLYAEGLGSIEGLRNMEFEFGVLPVPLYDENQDRYYSFLNCWGSNSFGIPTSLEEDEAENVMVIMNALGSVGKTTIAPAYIETTLKGQRLRDDDSEEMLDIIFENIGCDIGHMFGFGNLGFDALHKLADGQSLATLMDSLKSKAQADIDKFVSVYFE